MWSTTIIIRSLLVSAGILVVPFFGNMYVDGWNWSWTAFAFFGAFLFATGLLYELAGKHAKVGVCCGFVFGGLVAGGVIATLRSLHPHEDVAGVVIITFLICGLFFSFAGFLIQKYWIGKGQKRSAQK